MKIAVQSRATIDAGCYARESQARRLLGIPSLYEIDGFLKAHGMLLEVTLDDVRRDSEVARVRQE